MLVHAEIAAARMLSRKQRTDIPVNLLIFKAFFIRSAHYIRVITDGCIIHNLQKIGSHPVVSVNIAYIFPSCLFQTAVSCGRKPSVFFIDYYNAAVFERVILQNISAFIRSAVINTDYFNLAQRLSHNTFDALAYVFFYIINRYYH